MTLIIESSTDLISEPTGVSRLSSDGKIIFKGNGINFRQFSEARQEVIIAEPVPPEIIPIRGRSRLLKLNLTIIDSVGSIRAIGNGLQLRGQVAARIKNLTLQNPRGQLRNIITNRGNFDVSDIRSGIYQLWNSDQPEEKTSIAIAQSLVDTDQCVNYSTLNIIDFQWTSTTDWELQLQLEVNNEACESCYQGYNVLVTDENVQTGTRGLISTTGPDNNPGGVIAFTSRDNPGQEINQTNNLAFAQTSSGCPQIQSDLFSYPLS